MKKLKVVLSVFLLTSFLVACKNPAGTVPEKNPGSVDDSSEGKEDLLPFSGTLSATENGIKFSIDVPENILRLQVFRKTPGASDYSFYANVDYLNNDNELEFFPYNNAVFEDPYVDSNEEYSYKVRFVTSGLNYSPLTESVTLTPNAGSGELKLLNKPAGFLDETKKKFTFTEKPEFSKDGAQVKTFMVILYQKPEWTGWGDVSFWVNSESDSFNVMYFGLDNGQFEKLNIQLGINAIVDGVGKIGTESCRISYNASNWCYKLENCSYEWKIEDEFPIDVGPDNGTSFTKNGELYNFSFSGTGRYNGLYTGVDPETGKTVGIFFIKKAGILYAPDPIKKSYITSSDNSSCIASVEKGNDGTWSFIVYKYSNEIADNMIYDEESDTWNLAGVPLSRSELDSLIALWG